MVWWIRKWVIAICKRVSKKKCKNNQACFNEALSDEETYNFKIDAKKQLSKAKDIFPECFDQKNQVTIKKESCNERKELFKRYKIML